VHEIQSQMHRGIRIILIMFLKLPQKTIKWFYKLARFYINLKI
jgi:hypothetical protein